MRLGTRFLYMYSELRRNATDVYLWHLVPKFHQFQHIILDSAADLNNPRFFHCFSDEDMVGKMLIVARAAHASCVADSALDNYAMGLVTRLEQLEAGSAEHEE